MGRSGIEEIAVTETSEADIVPRSHRDSNPTLSIVGKNSFQNELLRVFLEHRRDLPCCVHLYTPQESMPRQASVDDILFLYDCFGLKHADIWIKLGAAGAPSPGALPVALFNVSQTNDLAFEKQAIGRQVRGVFYINESPELLIKGIQKIFQGELWYSRKATSAVLIESQRYKARTELAEVMLTPREKEILIAIASGAGNNDIADEFCISLHTVKTHIYNIYKKIDVRNRLEATLWVARYL